jgi:tocopherol cyclase
MLTLHPERYHGHGRRPPFFEGWYFKLVDAAGQERYAIIPGIFLSHDPAKQHAFIQVLDGLTGQATYHRYPSDQFWAADDRFAVRIGQSEFSSEAITLAIADEQRTLHGRITFSPLTPWPVRWYAPGIMGPFGWIPNMECNHGVVSLDHALAGELMLDGRRLDFTDGRGYIEKDWGKSFPAGYVWMQTNHFGTLGTSFVGSIAVIPWLGSHFIGSIIGLWHAGTLHRFATYTGAKTTHLHITDSTVEWVVKDRRQQLAITAQRAQGGLLLGPTRENMSDRVGETMLATVHLKLTTADGRTLLDDIGRHAGLEVHGQTERLRG